MTKLSVLNNKGKEVEKIELDPVVFDGKINNVLIHQAVVTYLAHQRKGLASTKKRGEVSGGGRKPWRQKGTGRARVGSNRSPLWKGGGVTFGPKPRSYDKDLPKKMKVMALKSALNAKLRDKEIVVLDGLELTSNKTKEFAAIIDKLKLNGPRLSFVVDNVTDNMKLSSRNLKKVGLTLAKDVSTYETINCKQLVLTKSALKVVEDRVKKYLKQK